MYYNAISHVTYRHHHDAADLLRLRGRLRAAGGGAEPLLALLHRAVLQPRVRREGVNVILLLYYYNLLDDNTIIIQLL